jgi:hypothetical protein
VLGDAHTARLAERLESDGDFGDFGSSSLEKQLLYLREAESESIESREYERAKELNILRAEIQAELSSRAEITAPPIHPSEDVEQLRLELYAAYREALQEGRQRFQERGERVERYYDFERESFELMWQLAIPGRYRKAHPHLVVLRKVEKRAGKLRLFDHAAELRNEANALQDRQAREAEDEMAKRYVRENGHLVARRKAACELVSSFCMVWAAWQKVRFERQWEVLDRREHVVQSKRVEAKKKKRESSEQIMMRSIPAIPPMKKEKPEPILLPELRPPNSPEMLTQRRLEKERQKQRNRQFKARQIEKEEEAQRSEPNTPRSEGQRSRESTGVRVSQRPKRPLIEQGRSWIEEEVPWGNTGQPPQAEAGQRAEVKTQGTGSRDATLMFSESGAQTE